MSNPTGSYHTERVSTSNTIPATYKPYQIQLSKSSDSLSVANCIRGLNETIEILKKENTTLRSSFKDCKPKEDNSVDLKSLLSSNESLKKKIKELKESNSDLHDRYSRVKDMYDMLSDQKSKQETLNSLKNSESSDLKEENKKLKAENSRNFVEIQRLKQKLSGLKEKIGKLERSKKCVLEENARSERFVNDIAGINEELLSIIRQKSRCFKHHGHKAASSKKINQAQSERQSLANHQRKQNKCI